MVSLPSCILLRVPFQLYLLSIQISAIKRQGTIQLQYIYIYIYCDPGETEVNMVDFMAVAASVPLSLSLVSRR